MLARASTKTFVSRVQKTAKKIFVSRKTCYQGHSLAEVSLYLVSFLGIQGGLYLLLQGMYKTRILNTLQNANF